MCGGVEYSWHGTMMRIYFPNPKARLPVRKKDGCIELLTWGRRKAQIGELPAGGWARHESIEKGIWNQWQPRPVKIIDRMDTPEMANEMLNKASEKGTWQYEAIETLLKGKEIPLKEGMCFHDKDGNERHDIRVRWWDKTAATYQDAFMGPESARTHIPDDEINGDHLVEYAHDAPPVFLGHYWMEGILALLAPNIACLDYSVAKSGGQLVAYRWDGEQILSNDKFVLVTRCENMI